MILKIRIWRVDSKSDCKFEQDNIIEGGVRVIVGIEKQKNKRVKQTWMPEQNRCLVFSDFLTLFKCVLNK